MIVAQFIEDVVGANPNTHRTFNRPDFSRYSVVSEILGTIASSGILHPPYAIQSPHQCRVVYETNARNVLTTATVYHANGKPMMQHYFP